MMPTVAEMRARIREWVEAEKAGDARAPEGLRLVEDIIRAYAADGAEQREA